MPGWRILLRLLENVGCAPSAQGTGVAGETNRVEVRVGSDSSRWLVNIFLWRKNKLTHPTLYLRRPTGDGSEGGCFIGQGEKRYGQDTLPLQPKVTHSVAGTPWKPKSSYHPKSRNSRVLAARMVEQNLIKTQMNLRPLATKMTEQTRSPIRIRIIKFFASWFLTPSQGVVPILSKSSTLNCGASHANGTRSVVRYHRP